MSKLEEMGTILMHIALQYTHPDFESMYSDWSTVHDIGEKLVKMSDQPQLNDNQQVVLEKLKIILADYDVYNKNPFETIYCFVDDYGTEKYYENLTAKQEVQVLQVFIQWALEQEE